MNASFLFLFALWLLAAVPALLAELILALEDRRRRPGEEAEVKQWI
jgi:hypothetical protein